MTLLFSEEYLRYGENQNAKMKPDFLKEVFDESGLSDVSFWEIMKSLEDQGVIINRPTKCASSFFLPKSFYQWNDNNSNAINTTPTVSFPSNTAVYPNCNTDISSLREEIDYLEQLFLRRNFKTLHICLRLNLLEKKKNTKTNLIYILWVTSRYNSYIKKRTH